MTYAERIAQFQKSVTNKTAEAQNMLDQSLEDGSTFTEEEETKYDELQAEVKSLEKHIERLQAQEATQSKSAAPVEDKSNSRTTAVHIKRETPKGVQMARYAKCIAAAGGNAMHAQQLAKANYSDTPAVEEVFRMKATW